MKYDLQFNIGEEWTGGKEMQKDDLGHDMVRFSASRPDGSFIDISLGDMPEGETAQDQAFANYADMVGFSDDDPEGYNPIARIMFNGKPAWGFDAFQEDDSPMRLLSQEVRSNVIAIIMFGAPDRDALVSLHLLIEHNFRVKAV